MKLLVLEDNNMKRDNLVNVISNMDIESELFFAANFGEFVALINRDDFDLVIADLLLPLHADSREEINVSNQLIANIRDVGCRNYNTPVIAVTGYDELAEECFSELNKFDITVITYEPDSDDWKGSFQRKIKSCMPLPSFEFVIVCALEKEADAFGECGLDVGSQFAYEGINCRNITIGKYSGVITLAPRMGLVNSAILSARVIDLFKPKLICMSGICAGIEGKSNIYDVVIPEIIHQHDSGKWTNNGFVTELYPIQLNHHTRLIIAQAIKNEAFLTSIKNGVQLAKTEFPIDSNVFNFEVSLQPTSSGSAVVADENMLGEISAQHRKMAAFEMESFALYEAARQSTLCPMYFSAKSVVDNGNSQKGDDFHRVACLLSAKVTQELIPRLLN
jgi:nucleoside phosphorylase/CheY-like chemotaxis protein